MKVRKWITSLVLFLGLVTAVMPACPGGAAPPIFDINSIKSYRDIPGLTAEEIMAIEALRSARASFSYGSMPTTEAFSWPNGDSAGFTVLFCELLSDLFGLPFVQEIHYWDSLKSGLDKKNIDFTGDLTPTRERKSIYFMTHPIAERALMICTYGDSVTIETEEDVNGLRLGFAEGTITAQSIDDVYPELTFEIVNVQSTPDSLEKLKSGVIDAFVDDAVGAYVYSDYNFIKSKGFFSLVYTPVSLTTANPELEPIISVMNKYLAAGGVDRLYELYKEGDDEYAKYKLSRSFSDEETAYIASLSASGAAVRVGLENDNYPISFYDEKQKEFHGIAPDILAEVSRLTGIKFEVATGQDTAWSEIVEKLRTDDIALVSELQYSKERGKDFIWAAEPYLTSHYALLSKLDYPDVEFYRVVRATVGVVKETAHEELYDALFPGNTNTKRYDTHFEALDALERGEIDLFMSSDVTLLTQMNYREKSGYKVNYIFTAREEKSFFGFNKNEKTLCSIIGKVQNFIETDKMAKEWGSRVYDYSKKLADERTVYMAVFAAILLLMLMLMTGLFVKIFRTRELYKQAVKAEQKASKSKSDFLAQMSHEIRTPMSAILGISEIQLRDERLSAGAEEGFRKIYDSGNLLLNIINDILDFSKIDAGKMEIVPHKYDIPSLVNDTVQLFRLRFESKLIAFNLRIGEDTPLELIGDQLRLRQILNNLLSNAFKYTETGEVRLSVAVEPGSGDETVMLVLKVSDTGQGMTKDQVKRIFDKYSRFNMAINSGIPGTGLGMNITKRLIEMMGGEIFVESEIGQGSVFTVRLPQKTCGSALCGAETVESLRNFSYSNTTKRAQITPEYMPYGRVLVVDDVESNLYVATGLLRLYGLSIETANSGFEAIKKIKDGGVYDVVFMDHMMPVMDGIKATNILRGSGYNQPIVALTANAISGQAEMLLSNGFDRFISKPIDSRELDLVLKELIRDRKPPETLEAARRERPKAVITPEKYLTELKKYFIKDAEGIIKVLEDIYAKIDGLDDTDIASYTTAVHGIKSALKNIGETRLSELALELEKAGEARDFDVVLGETPALLENLKALIAKLKPQEKSLAGEVSREDRLYLKEKLYELGTACETFNIRAAETVLLDLGQRSWPGEIDEALNEISLSLLRGEFKKAVSLAKKITKGSPD
jgi:signal transduction histidine kinase/ABC-type amino acid transport substrate-binding protein/DNA-binding NarL/FixJ family response regulator